ncbi:MAG TPA: GNAT family N-acetyltransferase [Usitatibacteraceae bacterium]|nr:GNAT family N-acetyltransferase [Usitatibacteraceae bacterium]
MILRDLGPDDAAEITLVARRMRDTLIEVEGAERGATLYTLEWLEQRVRWHLDRRHTTGRVVVTLDDRGEIVGHSIFRIEGRDAGPYGLISTTYVVPAARRGGCAVALLQAAEAWFVEQGISHCCTWTSSTNVPLIRLYTRAGYAETERGPNDLTDTIMVRLSRQLPVAKGR